MGEGPNLPQSKAACDCLNLTAEVCGRLRVVEGQGSNGNGKTFHGRATNSCRCHDSSGDGSVSSGLLVMFFVYVCRSAAAASVPLWSL